MKECICGNISSWKEGFESFCFYTFISLLALGVRDISGVYKTPTISKGIPTATNKLLEKSINSFEKTLYCYGQNADNTTSLIMIIFGVKNYEEHSYINYK